MTPARWLSSLRPSHQKVIALGLTAALLTLCCTYLLPALTWLVHSQSQWRSRARAELAEARGRGMLIRSLREQLTALPQAPVLTLLYYAKKAELSAAVSLDVAQIAAATGVTLQTTTPLPDVHEGELISSGVRVTAAMTADQLRHFAERLRSHQRLLRVQRLTITSPQVQAADQNAAVTVWLDVWGYSKVTDSSAPPSKLAAGIRQAGRR